MKVQISSLENLASIQDSLENNDSIEITSLDSSVIPYLDLFIDRCKECGCNVQINEQVLVDLDILEHFSDRV